MPVLQLAILLRKTYTNIGKASRTNKVKTVTKLFPWLSGFASLKVKSVLIVSCK